ARPAPSRSARASTAKAWSSGRILRRGSSRCRARSGMRCATIGKTSRRMRPGRNDPCPCASGKKFKHCCGRPLASASGAAAVEPEEIGKRVGMVHAGRLQQAEERASTLLRAQPAAGMLWKILSIARLRQGKDALDALRRAAQLLAEDAEAHANLGSELHSRGEWAAARSSLRRSLELEPRNADALIEAADAERALGRPRDAVPLYER